MSIIGNFTAEPNRVEMLIDFLKSTKKQHTKEDLENLFSPTSGRGSSSVFREVYNVVESLGLVKIENDFVKLNIENSKYPTSQIIKEIIFNKDFIKQDNLALAIGWLLIQNSIDSLDWGGSEDRIGAIVRKDFNEEYTELDLTNNSRWQHFGYWCIYLGFARKVYLSDNTFVCPDPTEAINNELKVIFKGKKELLIRDFLDILALKLPVLEFGFVRNQINEYTREGLKTADNTLSFATSLALLRLEFRKVIKIIHKSDANSVLIQNGENNKIISHIIYEGK